jgi:hypothetical protein
MRTSSSRKVALLVAASTVFFLVEVNAQSQVPGGAPIAATATINLTVEQRHVIKEIVLKDMKVASVTGDVPMAEGAMVPQTVALQSFPAEISDKVPQVKSHNFFVRDDRIALVDKERRVVEVIE